MYGGMEGLKYFNHRVLINLFTKVVVLGNDLHLIKNQVSIFSGSFRVYYKLHVTILS